ncbi:hypothetical protein [Sphingobacterium sp. 18053]|uniref:hypothetical protein n=1 Tax=Sphingobacterium sp. 18053 TaxID=2681401 RepID=UPI001359A886|nr:hypothetical protein [Sphingobacterium sp. 18053]
MRLLIVEDDLTQIQLYKDLIESFNRKNAEKITPIIFDNLADGKNGLSDSDYDAAIIDLKLSANAMDLELEGIQLVDEIIDKLRFPLYIVSGSIGQIDRDENFLFKKRARDGDFSKVLSELMGIYNTGITNILGRKGKIDDYLNSIFWKHLSTAMDIWINDETRTSDQKQKTLERYILLHIQEYLDLTTESNFENYHPAEIYITPPVKDKVFTGDLVKENSTNKRFLVLTPSCDLAQSKAKDILLAEIESESEGLLAEKIGIIKKNKADKDVLVSVEKELKSLIGNNYSNKYHFLPKYNSIQSGLINFQKLKTCRVRDFEKDFERIASINSNFTKDIVARFSYYYSRQGSPDFDRNEIYTHLLQ